MKQKVKRFELINACAYLMYETDMSPGDWMFIVWSALNSAIETENPQKFNAFCS